MEGFQEKLKQFWASRSPNVWGIKLGRDKGGDSEMVKATITRNGNVVVEGLSDPMPSKGSVSLDEFNQQAISRVIDYCPPDPDEGITGGIISLGLDS